MIKVLSIISDALCKKKKKIKFESDKWFSSDLNQQFSNTGLIWYCKEHLSVSGDSVIVTCREIEIIY